MAFYRLWIPLGLLDSYPGLILAHTILAAPMVLITVSASLATFDPRLEQASKNLGDPSEFMGGESQEEQEAIPGS